MKNKIINKSFIISLLLSFCGGFIELYSVKIHGVFACMQTGNMINMFANFFDNKIYLGLENISVAVIFFLGCILAETLKLKLENKIKYFNTLILFLMIVFASIIVIFPLNIDNASKSQPNVYDIISNACLALIGAFQFCIFKEVNNIGYTSTMMTATLRNISANLVSGIIEKNKTKLVITLEYIAFLFCFILGSIIFYILFKYNSNRNNLLLIQLLPLIISFTLLITLIISIFVDKEKYSDKKNKI